MVRRLFGLAPQEAVHVLPVTNLADDRIRERLIADAQDPGVRLGRYGVIEMQTTDTHGTYRLAVDALRGALDLHAEDFGEQVAAHPDWSGRRVEHQ